MHQHRSYHAEGPGGRAWTGAARSWGAGGVGVPGPSLTRSEPPPRSPAVAGSNPAGPTASPFYSPSIWLGVRSFTHTVTISDQLEILKSLAVVDTALSGLLAELEAEGGALTAKKAQLEGLEAKVQRSEQSIGEMEHTRNELMLEIRQMSVQVSKSREKLSRCRTE